METEIQQFIIYLHNIKNTSTNTELSYQRDLLKIAPYIEQQELDRIKSDWVCMQTKEDYEEIYKQIDEIKNEHSLP